MSRCSSSTSALGNVWQRFVLAVLRPAVPSFESFAIHDQLRAHDIVLDVVVREVLATFVADATGMSPGAPFGAVDLEYPEAVAGGTFRSGDQLRVHTALVLHQTDPRADVGPGGPGSLELVHGFALGEDLRFDLNLDRQDRRDRYQQPQKSHLRVSSFHGDHFRSFVPAIGGCVATKYPIYNATATCMRRD